MNADRHDERDEESAGLARYLDGRDDSPLSAEAGRRADEIRGDEAWLADRLDVNVPRAAMFRAGMRLDEALASQARPGRRRWAIALGGALAAAALVAIVSLWLAGWPIAGNDVASLPDGGQQALDFETAVADEQMLVLLVELGLAGEVDELPEEILSDSEPSPMDEQTREMLAELALIEPSELDLQFDANDSDAEDYWLDGTSNGQSSEPQS